MQYPNEKHPRCGHDEIEALIACKLHDVWIVRTQDTLADVLLPGYFDKVASHGLRTDDTIQVGGQCRAAQVLIDSSAVKAHRCASGGKGGSATRRSGARAAGEPQRSTP
jgi:hypothetical protein